MEYSGAMSITLPLAEMTVEEKLEVMEQIWDDLTAGGNDIVPREWQDVVLAMREKAIEEGTNELVDLDTAWAELTSKRKT